MKSYLIPAMVLVTLTCIVPASHGADVYGRTVWHSEGTSVSQTKEEIAAEKKKQLEWATLASQQEKITLYYVAATLRIAEAQIKMAEALDLKEQALALKVEADALGSDSVVDKDQLIKYTKVSKDTNKLIQKKLKANVVLGSNQRVEFLRGTAIYADGITQTDNVIDEMEPFAESLQMKLRNEAKNFKKRWDAKDYIGLIPGQSREAKEIRRKFTVGFYLVKSMPKLFGNHVKTLSRISSYVETNQMQLPKDATLALSKFDKKGSKKKKGGIWQRSMDAVTGVFGGKKCDAPSGSYCLWIDVTPSTARIILPDIKPSYTPGMALAQGTYRIKVVAEGYNSETRSADLSQGSDTVNIDMTPKS